MRRLLAIAVPAVLLLGAPVSAPAKGIMGATVCGADGCKTVQRVDEGLLGGGAATSPPSAREPFVRLELRVGVPGHTERVRQLFVPGSELVVGEDGVWRTPLALGALHALARHVTPLPASELPNWAALGTARPTDALAPEVFDPAALSSAASSDGGLELWWLALPATAVALAACAMLARRRRRGGPRGREAPG